MAPRTKAKPDCPVEAYARAVVEGDILACKFVRQACERHIKDMKTAKARGFYFDHEAAQHAIDFFPFLSHSKGKWSGRPFELELWQKFIVGSIFGWRRTDNGLRRFRTIYTEVPRKNGKSQLAAGVGLYLLVADGEPGAEVYSAATKKDQARIVHAEAVRMVKKSPALNRRLKVHKDNIHIPGTATKYEPLGADEDSLDGLNVHGAIVDELHAHKKRGTWDVLDTATGARDQAMLFAITTAGTDRESVCWEQHEYAEKVLSGVLQDDASDAFFAFIATLDDEDDWKDPKVWIKANPNLGISVNVDDLKRQVEKAKRTPGQVNPVLRLRFNRWTQQATRWLDLDVWDESAGIVVEDKLAGRTCFGGLDLSSVSDITAWVMVFPREDDPEEVDVLCRFWCPEARLHDDNNRYQASYQKWHNLKLLTATPGDAIDYEFVKAQILADAQRFKLEDMNIDRLFQAHQLASQLSEEGLTVIGMGQGFMSMSTPSKELERRLLVRKIRHGGNQVLRWMADNVAIKHDPAGNIKPDKKSSQGKIDGIVALIMALDRAMRHAPTEVKVSDEGGVIWIG